MRQKVSVIVPNYNYAHLLKRRLDSIAYQSTKPEEIIFLDDCSTDDSVDIAKQLLDTYGIEYTILANTANQGVFKQWLKGISAAKYDYVWIAESDDYCELSFLQELLTPFIDDKVILSYCQSKYIKNSKVMQTHADVIANYMDASRWRSNYINQCGDEACNYLSVFSTIANASAVVFNKNYIPLSKLDKFTEFKMAGDWLFYLIFLFENQTNKISYCSLNLNYWLQHKNSVWGQPQNTLRGMLENLAIFNIILTNYTITPVAKRAIFDALTKFYLFFPTLDNNYIKQLGEVLLLLGVDTYEYQIDYLYKYLSRFYYKKHYFSRKFKTVLKMVPVLNVFLRWIKAKWMAN